MRYSPILIFIGALWSASGSWAEATVGEGKGLFDQYCAVCHGFDAKGGGAAAASLGTKPADLTGMAARRGGVWPMLEVMSIIDGYTKQQNPREDMPIIPEITTGRLMDFDTGNGLVTSVPARLVALVNYLESIQSPKPERYVP